MMKLSKYRGYVGQNRIQYQVWAHQNIGLIILDWIGLELGCE